MKFRLYDKFYVVVLIPAIHPMVGEWYKLWSKMYDNTMKAVAVLAYSKWGGHSAVVKFVINACLGMHHPRGVWGYAPPPPENFKN